MSTKLTGSDESLKAAFEALKTIDDVARLLDVDVKVLRFFIYKKQNYTTFQIRKRSGGERTISTPQSSLKLIQRKLNQVLHAVYKRREPVHGFVRSRSIRTNATKHLNRNHVLTMDLEDFFPSIHFGRVKGLFQSWPCNLPEPVALVLAQICCYEKKLPIGAPTSPMIANMICAKMDSELKTIALRHDCTYTRYADDITFSTRSASFPREITYRDPNSAHWLIGVELSEIVCRNSFAINASKVRVLSRGRSCQEVTGLVTNVRLNVKREYIRQVRATLHLWRMRGEEAAAQEFFAKHDRKQRATQVVDFSRVVRGKIDFIGHIRGRDDFLFIRLLDKYLKLDKDGRFQTITITPGARTDIVAEAIWLLETEDGEERYNGTAFAFKGYGLITARHNIKGRTIASRPHAKLGSTEEFEVHLVS